MNTHSTASQDLDLLLGRVATEFFERLSRGEAPQVDEYVQLHPEIAEMIRHALPALQMVTDSLADASSIALSPGERHEKQLGDFHILHELGRGGMGIVYEAEQISMGRRKVALKVLPFALVRRSNCNCCSMKSHSLIYWCPIPRLRSLLQRYSTLPSVIEFK